MRNDGLLYYGNTVCQSPDEAYKLFREDYHKSIGRDANRKLNREGQRTDVLHWKGFTLSKPYFEYLKSKWEGFQTVRSSVIGILQTSYCRTVACEGLEKVDDSSIDECLDWVLSDCSNVLVLVNRKNGLGRTNRKNKSTFRK